MGGVNYTVTVQVSTGAAVPDLELGRIAEQQPCRLERDLDVGWVDRRRDQHRVARGEVAEAGHPRRIGNGEAEERCGGISGGAEVVDLDGTLLPADRPERRRVTIKAEPTSRSCLEGAVHDLPREGADRGELRRGAPRPRDEMRGEGLLHPGGMRSVGATGSEHRERERDQGTPNGHTSLRVHRTPTTLLRSSRSEAAPRRRTEFPDSRGAC